MTTVRAATPNDFYAFARQRLDDARGWLDYARTVRSSVYFSPEEASLCRTYALQAACELLVDADMWRAHARLYRAQQSAAGLS